MYIVLYVQYVLLDISVNTYKHIILTTCTVKAVQDIHPVAGQQWFKKIWFIHMLIIAYWWSPKINIVRSILLKSIFERK
jgi:hypothetical protein